MEITFFQGAVVLPDLPAHRPATSCSTGSTWARACCTPSSRRSERDKAVPCARSVGPAWDGNEVWLLTAGGALFAAFPPAYATTFSGFYLAVMLVLFGLIVRAGVAGVPRDTTRKWAARVGRLLRRGVPACRRCCWAWPWATSTRASPWTPAGDYAGLPAALGLITPFTLLCTGLLGLAMFLAASAPRGLLAQGAEALRAAGARRQAAPAAAGGGAGAVRVR